VLDHPRASITDVHVWPNPSRGSVQVALSAPATLRVFDALGRIIRESYADSPGTVRFDALPPGVHVLAVWSGREVVSSAVLIVLE
jgi:hypothetical protein